MANQKHQDNHGGGGHHHILSTPMALKIFGLLLLLTAITVAAAQVDLGVMNFAVAMIIASIKATLVCLFFMGLKYDHKENAVIFSTSLIFMAIFMVLTFGDLLTRGDVYVKNGKILPDVTGQVKSKFTKPWIVTPELLANGKEQFQSQCIACHGPTGHGDGPAAAGLNPKPRNFTSADGWKQGRKPSEIFHTISTGLGGMPSFASAPADDRWSLVHYVRSLGPTDKMPVDSPDDLKKIGIDPNSDGTSGSAEKVIPIDMAIDEMAIDNPANAVAAPVAPAAKAKKK